MKKQVHFIKMMAVAARVAAAGAVLPAQGASIAYLNGSGVTDLSDTGTMLIIR